MQLPVYLDHNATTPLDPRVLAAMQPSLREQFGNPASREHVFGWQAAEAVAIAREQVARLIGADTGEIVFTSGATESNNLALKGAFAAHRRPGRDRIVTVVTEHKAVLDPCAALEREGANVTRMSVGPDGRIGAQTMAEAVTPDTVLVSIMLANNEIGTVQPVAEIARIAHARGALVHSDAAQAVGKLPVDVDALEVDLLSISGHKLHGPKGIGALYVRRKPRRVRLVPLIDGGGHESGLRSGTLNVPGVVGLGAACAVAAREMADESERLRALRDRLLGRIRAGVPDMGVNGSLVHRLPGNLSVSFPGVRGDALLAALRDVAASSSAACTSADPRPSHVLAAIGLSRPLIGSTIRFGIGRFNTLEEIDFAGDRVVEAVLALRERGTPQGSARSG